MEGLVIGPVTHNVSRERVAAFVDVTGDDAERWRDHAPPGYAAALLFAVAGDFLTDPRIAPYLATLIHIDQQFTFSGPIPIDADVVVTGTVDRVRERGGAYFVTFVASGEVEGEAVLESKSTFLMSDEAAGEVATDEGEPVVDDRAQNDAPEAVSGVGVGSTFTMAKSASRKDLIRYSAATGDFNPLHWDHESARAAGLDGVVVHGLLMLSWLAQQASAFGADPVPVIKIKARFRSALRPADAAQIEATVKTIATDVREADVGLRLTAADNDVITGSAVVRLEAVTP
ncbi:MAG: MaoC/PaaZ C-terminal domain-containing protein, partial [Actinomycetota bacterium]|nr:MaoC/PaaZ C-terminal domain-containing protein [Actinomycetota bacterium]